MSSSSIEGMIKFGMPKKTQPEKRNYRSPKQTHNYTQLNRSRSPNGIERDQINSIIDEITNQMKAAE